MKKITNILSMAVMCVYAQHAMAWVDMDVQHFLNVLNSSNSKPMEQLTPKDARNVLVQAQKSAPVNMSGVDVQQKIITVNNNPVSLTIVRPTGATGTLPVFMFFHGGGWVLGDYATHARLVRDLVVDSGAVAVVVNYTRSPEAHYPVAINQAYAATKWVAEHGSEINVDPNRLAVVGNSVGGNMATVVSLMAKDKGAPKIKFQLLLWPVTDASFDDASYNQFAKGYFLTKNMMTWFWDNYTKDPKQRKEIYASPLQATLAQLKGLPPAYVVTAGNDVLRDEGEAYAGKLDAAGVPVVSVRYNGVIHDFGLLNPINQVTGTQVMLLQAGAALKKALQ